MSTGAEEALACARGEAQQHGVALQFVADLGMNVNRNELAAV